VNVSGLTLANAKGGGCWGGGMGIDEQYGITNVRDCIMRDNFAEFGGGGVYITDSGAVSLLNCLIIDNSVDIFGGGGIYSYYNDNVTISNCEISGNSGLVDTLGGGIYADECLSFQLMDSCVNGNSSDSDGGGIYGVALYDTSISRCTFDGNSTNGSGGGIYLSFTRGTDVVQIEACTVSNNQAAVNGGGLLNGKDPPAGISSAVLTNCTVYGNVLTSPGNGGGIFNSGQADLRNCTIGSNDAGTGGAGGGYFEASPHTGIFKNTILAENTAGAGSPNDIAGGLGYVFISNGHNICTTNAPAFFNQPTDNNTTDPGLGPLQDNGGLTFTCDIGMTSPAFDTAQDGPTTDQRGYPRPACCHYDVGAYELQPVAPTVTAIVPGSGLNSGTVNIADLAGANFVSGATVRLTRAGQPDIHGSSVVFISPNKLTCTFDLTGVAAGSWNVVVTNLCTASGVLPDGFTVTVPPVPPAPPATLQNGVGGQTPHGGSGGDNPTGIQTVALSNVQLVSARLSDSVVAPGAPVTVTAHLVNRGTANGSKKITVYVNGQVEAVQGTTMNRGGSTTLTFYLSRSEPGDYAVYVNDMQAGSFKVEVFKLSDIVLWLSMACVLASLILGVIMLWRRR
ncbi:MAG: choice-of-anchor Q domain-containing protein, partial [Dehalococcoidia bacterium]